jgi:hypothetical protein
VAFTYDVTTDIGKVRLLTADTDRESYDFEDAEIEFALDEYDDIRRAAAMLLTALASNRARLAVRVGRGNVNEDLTQVAKELREQAAALISQAEDAEDEPLEAVINPQYERLSAARNYALEREGEVGEAP